MLRFGMVVSRFTPHSSFSLPIARILLSWANVSTTNGEQARAIMRWQGTIHIHVYRVFSGFLGVSLDDT